MISLIYSKIILAKVIFKSTKKEFKGGCLFFMNLIDDTGVIKCIGYNRDCNRFYNVIKVINNYYKYIFNLKFNKILTNQFL